MKKSIVGIVLLLAVLAGGKFAVEAMGRQMACEEGTGRVLTMLRGVRAGASPQDYQNAVVRWRGFGGSPEQFAEAADELDALALRSAFRGETEYTVTGCTTDASADDIALVAVTVDGRSLVFRSKDQQRLTWQ